jgi:hypothetical protein
LVILVNIANDWNGVKKNAAIYMVESHYCFNVYMDTIIASNRVGFLPEETYFFQDSGRKWKIPP